MKNVIKRMQDVSFTHNVSKCVILICKIVKVFSYDVNANMHVKLPKKVFVRAGNRTRVIE